MATYYVDPSAETNGSGTLGSPFNTWPASSTLTADGDSLLFRRGTTLTVTGIAVAESGSAWRFIARNNVRIGAYADTSTGADDPSQSKPVITASRPNGSGVSILFRLSNSFSGLVVEDIVFRDCRFGSIFNISQTSSVTWRRVECYDLLGVDESLTAGGDFFGVGGTAPLGTVTIEDCVFDRCGNDAVWISAANVIVRRCRITRASIATTNGDCLQIAGSNTQNVIVQDCYLDHSGIDQKQCFLQSGSTVGRVVFERNTCIGHPSATVHVAVYVEVAAQITRNRIFASRVAVFATHTDTVLLSNVIVVNGNGQANQGFVQVGNSGKVYGNTIVNPLGAATDNRLAAIHDVLGGSDTTDKRNNVIVGFAQGIRHNPGGIETNNAFFDVTTPVTNRQTSATITPDASDITGDDSMLTSTYRPLTSSPLLRAGDHVGYQRDFDGHQRPNPPSIGAFDGPLFVAYEAP